MDDLIRKRKIVICWLLLFIVFVMAAIRISADIPAYQNYKSNYWVSSETTLDLFAAPIALLISAIIGMAGAKRNLMKPTAFLSSIVALGAAVLFFIGAVLEDRDFAGMSAGAFWLIWYVLPFILTLISATIKISIIDNEQEKERNKIQNYISERE